MTVYDVHAHCVPTGLLDRLEGTSDRYGAETVRTDDGGVAMRFAGGGEMRAIREDLRDVDARLRSMDEAGVDVQLVSTWMDITGYGLPDDAAVHYTRAFNDALAELVAAHPDRFLGLCNVPLQNPDAAAKELRRAVVEDGMVGVEIGTTVDGVDLDRDRLDPFWAQAAELRCPVLLHPYMPLAGRDVARYLLENLVGRAAETTIALGYLIFGGVLERFPDLQLISVHGGGFAPWQSGRWDRGYDAIPGKTAVNLSRAPSEWLHEIHFDTVLHDATMLGYLIDWAGADHVVLGTDYPFPMGDLAPLQTLDAVTALSDDDRARITSGNVQALIDGIRR